MKKTIAIVLLALLVCSMSVLAVTLPKVTKKDAASSTLNRNLAQKLFADNFKDLRAPRVRIPPPACVREATPDTFDRMVLESSLPVVVDFWAPWCGWCTRFKPVFEQTCNEYKGRMNFVSYNTDLDEGVWARFGIRGIPVQIFFNDGSEVERNEGYVPITVFRGVINSVLRNL